MALGIFTLLADVYGKAAALSHYLCVSHFVMATFLMSDKVIGLLLNFPSLVWNRFKIYLREHGPSILDVVLAFRLVRIFRLFHTRIINLRIATKNRPSILKLPDELLWEILEWMAVPSHQAIDDAERLRTTSTRDLLNLSMTNKRLRELACSMIFKTIVIERGWTRSRRQLNAIESSTTAQWSVVELKFNSVKGYNKPTHLADEMPTMLVSALPKLQKLERLHLIIQARHAKAFETAFLVGEVVLPKVRTLVVGPNLDFIIPACPKVTSISTTNEGWPHSTFDELQYTALIKAAGQARMLKHFQMSLPWETSHLCSVLAEMPNIERLGMLGGRYKDDLDDLLPILAKFTRLHTLEISDNVYLDAPFVILTQFSRGDDYRPTWAEQRQSAAEKVLLQLPELCELCFAGHLTAYPSKTNTGNTGDIKWSQGSSESSMFI